MRRVGVWYGEQLPQTAEDWATLRQNIESGQDISDALADVLSGFATWALYEVPPTDKWTTWARYYIEHGSQPNVPDSWPDELTVTGSSSSVHTQLLWWGPRLHPGDNKIAMYTEYSGLVLSHDRDDEVGKAATPAHADVQLSIAGINSRDNTDGKSYKTLDTPRPMSENNDYDEDHRHDTTRGPGVDERNMIPDNADSDLARRVVQESEQPNMMIDGELVELTQVIVTARAAHIRFEQVSEDGGRVRVFAVQTKQDIPPSIEIAAAVEILNPDAADGKGTDMFEGYKYEKGKATYTADKVVYDKFYVEGVKPGNVTLKLVLEDEKGNRKPDPDQVCIRVETVKVYVAMAYYAAKASIGADRQQWQTFRRRRSNTTGCDVTYVYSDKNDFGRFAQAWKDNDVIIYGGHANSGLDLDITGTTEHVGSGSLNRIPSVPFFPRLKATLPNQQFRVKLVCLLSCNGEVPYAFLDSVTERLKRDFKINAIGHRSTGEMRNTNDELERVIQRILNGAPSTRERQESLPSGPGCLAKLTALDIGTDDGITKQDLAKRFLDFTTDGTTVFYHDGLAQHRGNPPNCGPERWRGQVFLFTEQDLLRGAEGKCLERHYLDDIEKNNAQGPNDVVVDPGVNKCLETVAQGDDVYKLEGPRNARVRTAILAGNNGRRDTSVAGVDQFIVRTAEEASSNPLVQAAIKGFLNNPQIRQCLDSDLRTGSHAVQDIMRKFFEEGQLPMLQQQ